MKKLILIPVLFVLACLIGSTTTPRSVDAPPTLVLYKATSTDVCVCLAIIHDVNWDSPEYAPCQRWTWCLLTGWWCCRDPESECISITNEIPRPFHGECVCATGETVQKCCYDLNANLWHLDLCDEWLGCFPECAYGGVDTNWVIDCDGVEHPSVCIPVGGFGSWWTRWDANCNTASDWIILVRPCFPSEYTKLARLIVVYSCTCTTIPVDPV